VDDSIDPAAPIIRAATAADRDAIAALHAASWAVAYRGVFSDHFLDHEVGADRAEVWRQRYAREEAARIVLVADRNGTLDGFVCAYVDHDEVHGTLIDNLHVHPELKRGGIGRRLLVALADRLPTHARHPAVHLWCYQRNAIGRAFYDRIGGRVVETVENDVTIGDIPATSLRYRWDSIDALRRGCMP
jgi:ribosomal protein S18 acetylase RimI-like enzyme